MTPKPHGWPRTLARAARAGGRAQGRAARLGVERLEVLLLQGQEVGLQVADLALYLSPRTR